MTDGGVSRFDRTHFETFHLADERPHLTVMNIVEEEDGRLLFGTLGGELAVLGPRGFQLYTTEHGLPCNDILDFLSLLYSALNYRIRSLPLVRRRWMMRSRIVTRSNRSESFPIGGERN